MTAQIEHRPFEVGIESAANGAKRLAHETPAGRIVNAVAKVTLDPILRILVDGPLKIKQGEGVDKNGR